MTMTISTTELVYAVRDATNLVSLQNVRSLLDRIAALRDGGEDEGRILARLNGPARIDPLTDTPSPSRGNAGMTERVAAQARAERVTADQLADAIAAKVVAQLNYRHAALDELAAAPIPDPPAPTVTTIKVCSSGHPPTPHVEGEACVPCAVGDGHEEWQTACPPPDDPRHRLRVTQRVVLDALRSSPITGLKPACTVAEITAELGIEHTACTKRVQALYRSGHLERCRMGGAFVYRLAVEWGDVA